MAFPDEDCAGLDSIHRIQECQRAFLKMEGCGVWVKVKLSKRKVGPARSRGVAGKVGRNWQTQHFFREPRRSLLFGNRELELQLDRSLQIHGLDQRFETISHYPQGIDSGFQVGRRKLALPIRRKHDRLRRSPR